MPIAVGSFARVRDDAPRTFRPGETGLVRGVRAIDHEPLARAIGAPVGSRLVLLEFADGVTTEIPERYLDGDAIA